MFATPSRQFAHIPRPKVVRNADALAGVQIARRIWYNTAMMTWRQRWRFWKHRLPDVVVSLLAVLVMTRYAATKPTNQLQNSGIVLLRSGGGSGAVVTAEDIARGYRLASVSTNVAVSYSCPTNGAVWASWTRRGAVENCGIVELCNR